MVRHSSLLSPCSTFNDLASLVLSAELFSWQEKRRQARLRGEYERSSRLLNEVVNDNLKTVTPLSALRVLNTQATRDSFLSSLFSPLLLQHSAGPQTLESLLALTQDIHATLAPFGVFKTIDVRLETAQSLLAKEGSVDVVVDVKEAPRLSIKSGTEVGHAEGNAYITANIRNVFGGAETLGLSTSVGTKTRSSFEGTLRTPLFASPLHSLAFSGFSFDRDNTAFASHWEQVQGGKLSYDTRTFLGGHSLTYEATQRTLRNLLPSASPSIREAARPGPSIKSAIAHTFLRDTRNSAFLATSGSLFKATQELAGFGGDAKHFKSTTETAMTRALGKGYFASFTTRTGLVLPLDPSKGTHLVDRVFMGGPTSVRGFKMNGMGPRDGNDSLGGELSYSLGASIFGPLPLRPHWPLKLHTFLNAGHLSSPASYASPQTILAPLLSSPPSVSAGVGIVYDFAPIRIEANFVVPLVGGSGEGLSKGFGLGMGMEFL
ncbi:surface antigen-domain-containing protein [Mrakia frigida]|uniref:SAM complex subunit SAM50 n=1 Tax=Mrakia frigida TaxID=29902 RepID=UPI003FCBFEF2